ncbi:MAG: hypothetical protein WC389_13835 [Lutibacter sp.]|jgi:hypothetical protein
MATGYTEYVGKGISFENFTMICARAFGALVEMRDYSLDATIPDEFKPSTYHIGQKGEAKQRLAYLRNLTLADAERLANEEFEKESARIKQSIKDNTELLRKYNDMILKVEAWQPPTPDHVGLKDFMLQQLRESIRFDNMCDYYSDNPPIKLSGKEWLDREKQRARKDFIYHNDEQIKENNRTNDRNKWIKDLRDSLKNVEGAN